jgi:DNA-binding MarR family transcriptional regulator
MTDDTELHDRLDRLVRLHAAGSRSDALNPTQAAALRYLARANRFSRSPSQVADYLAATRGTVSQTLKSLARKGLIDETPSPGDGRSVSYALTRTGAEALTGDTELLAALKDIDEAARRGLAEGTTALLRRMVARTGNRGFGLCRRCRHHRVDGDRRHCALLGLALATPEADQLCHEYSE